MDLVLDLEPPPSLRFVLEDAADSGARFVPLAGATADNDDASAAADGRLALLAGSADAAANRLCAVACLASSFFLFRAASAARCFSSAASAACCFALAASNMPLSNADLAAGSPESSNTNVGHSN